MAASPGMIPARQLDNEFVAAASAVFGVLEVIGEDECSERTRENLAIARKGAERCLAELGLERDDLRGLSTAQPPGTSREAPGTNVVPLRGR
jgi:hypothetical protein